jgi:hypothetical protein
MNIVVIVVFIIIKIAFMIESMSFTNKACIERYLHRHKIIVSIINIPLFGRVSSRVLLYIRVILQNNNKSCHEIRSKQYCTCFAKEE